MLNPVLSDLGSYIFIQNVLLVHPMDLRHILPTYGYLDLTQGPVSIKWKKATPEVLNFVSKTMSLNNCESIQLPNVLS